ncbi:carboxymuconolactone decarboxylase family protein [Cellulosimicrobium sp. CUA-896]|uniref:carboxymuconolactone decarboxylase family protein n=1 Tax=Cellulosimicrobium sp. CUA-896 TaxID=1517881 RepID=UPI0009F8F570|nr:carboxymuconolactone decarboxylase family protein [Cellulosimicrobium sp. CUA-896]
MDYEERLQRLTVNDPRLEEGRGLDPGELDPRTLALVRLAALVAVGGADPTYGAEVDAAVGAGASAGQIVDVLSAVIPIVGLPNVVAAAPRLALALGLEPVEGLWDDAVPGAPPTAGLGGDVREAPSA